MPVRVVRQKLVRRLGHEGEPELFKLLVGHLQLLLYPLLDGGEQLTLATGGGASLRRVTSGEVKVRSHRSCQVTSAKWRTGRTERQLNRLYKTTISIGIWFPRNLGVMSQEQDMAHSGSLDTLSSPADNGSP